MQQLSPLSLNINSTVDFASVLDRQLKDACVLPLERGFIKGLVKVFPLPNIRLCLIESNKEIAICANRSLGKLTFTIDLSFRPSSSSVVAQGVSLSRPAIFGFNSSLKDLDLHMNSYSRLCSIVVPVKYLSFVLRQYRCLDLREFFDRYNVFTSELVSSRLAPMLKQLFSASSSLGAPFTAQHLENEIMSTLIECFVDNQSRKLGIVIGRKERHEAAMKVLSMTSNSPRIAFEIQDLSMLLHQSRSSLFNGCKEKFGMSPVEVVRSVRLHQVRHALLDTEFCIQNNLDGVIDIANYFGFAGRSHFTRYYKQQFLETPRQTLVARRDSEKKF
ncbi:helix-turn-helix domain-containing protein [Synechococcus sp. MU1655]|uniref:helix-turn-helix domain-containing protein n=1 Tax=Synechococcus sp. MU1655 TaxID=2508355 RepID=UPI002026B651